MLNPGMDTSTKIAFASLYLEGPADHWFQTIQVEQPCLTWEAFVDLLLQRFSSGNQENLVGRFNKLVQKGTVAEYIAEFEELRGYVLTHTNVQTPNFYLSSFLSGLRQTSNRPYMCISQELSLRLWKKPVNKRR